MGAQLVLIALYLVATAIASAVGVVSWRRRHGSLAAVALTLTTAGAAWWSFGDAVLLFLLVHAPPSTDGMFVAAVMFGSAVVLPGFTLLTGALRDPSWRPRRSVLALLAIEPLLVAVMAVLDHRLHLVVAEVGARGAFAVEWTPGPGFWAHAAYCWAASTANLALLVGLTRHSSRLHRAQARYLLAGGLFPLLANSVSLALMLNGTPIPELGGLAFTVTGLLDAHALFRVGFLRLVPVARGLVLDHLTDAVLVLSPSGLVVDANAAARRLLRERAPTLRDDVTGLSAAYVAAMASLPSPLRDGEFETVTGDRLVVLDLRVERMHDARGRHLATVVVARDVTELHHRRSELAGANQQLRAQVRTIDALRAELEELAVRDELTGLHNRRFLLAALREQITASLATGAPLSVVVLDLDHFKSVNDAHGHLVGDALLAAVARELASGLRESDCVARYGGEEFVVLLPGTMPGQAQARVQEWSRRCAAVGIPVPHGEARTTVSAGVAALGPGRETPESLLKAADEALYAAKAGGRNRVVLA